jgi:hypothetical protein
VDIFTLDLIFALERLEAGGELVHQEASGRYKRVPGSPAAIPTERLWSAQWRAWARGRLNPARACRIRRHEVPAVRRRDLPCRMADVTILINKEGDVKDVKLALIATKALLNM